MMVSAKDFCGAFAKQWKEDAEKNRDAILFAYGDDKRWTEYMLAEKGRPYESSFLRRLLTQPSLGRGLLMGREWYTLDAVYYEKDGIYQPRGGGPYPDCMQVIIEHENAEDVETEMWKLLMFRSPLKVLIFYDYRHDDKQTEKKKTWLEDKLKTLRCMCNAVDKNWPEARNTEYLFLIGNRDGSKDVPMWRYGIIQNNGWSGLACLI